MAVADFFRKGARRPIGQIFPLYQNKIVSGRLQLVKFELHFLSRPCFSPIKKPRLRAGPSLRTNKANPPASSNTNTNPKLHKPANGIAFSFFNLLLFNIALS